MTIGPEPIKRIFLRSVRLGTRHYPSIRRAPIKRIFLRSVRLGTRHYPSIRRAPIWRIFLRSVRLGTRLAFDLAVDDRDLGSGLLALVEHVVEPARAEPHRLAVAPEPFPEHAHALLHALLDGVRLKGELALAGEGGPLRLLAAFFRLAVRDQVFRHRSASLLAFHE